MFSHQKNNIKELLLTLFSFVLPFVVYIYTLCPTVSAYADAGEFPTAAYVSGFGHPPGYPLFVLIIKLFLFLPFGNPALKANLATAFIAAITVALFYLLMKRILNNSNAAFASSQILAFSQIFWRNAIISEVFALLAFFIVLTLLLYLKWIKTGNRNFFLLFLLTCGFGLAHQQLIIITLFPLVVDFLFSKRWRLLKITDYLVGIPLVFIGFLPYLYILLYAAPRQPVMDWNSPTNLTNLFRLITRASYGTFKLTSQAEPTDTATQILGLIVLLINNVSILAVILAVLGSYYAFLKNKKILMYAIIVISVVFIFSFVSGMPVYHPGEIQYLERFQIISIIFITILIGFGVKFVLKKIYKLKNKSVKPLIISGLLLLPLLILILNFNKVSQRNNYFADNMFDDLMRSVPKKSIFIMDADSIINTCYYEHYVLGKRPDVTFIVASPLADKLDWYLAEIKHNYPKIILPDNKLASDDYLYSFFELNGVKNNISFYMPITTDQLQLSIPAERTGLIWQYVKGETINKSVHEENKMLKALANIKNPQTIRKIYWGSAEFPLLDIYAAPYVFLAEINDQDMAKSEKYYNKALEIMPENFNALTELGDDYQMHNQPDKAISYWQQAKKYIWDSNKKNELQNKIDQYQNANRSLKDL